VVDPAQNPIAITVRSNEAKVPLPLKEFDPIVEAVFQYGDVPN